MNLETHEADVSALLKAYETAGSYRNNIAHGMGVQPHRHGYFLCAPSYATKKRLTAAYPTQEWGLGSAYFYKVEDIEHCTERFVAIRDEAMRLALSLNDEFSVFPAGHFHP